MTSEASDDAPDDDLRFLCDGVIELAPSERARSLTVGKFRGSDFRAGEHTLRLGGTERPSSRDCCPRRTAQRSAPTCCRGGSTELDAMTHGGLERGTVTLITGPSGVGKTTLGTQFMKQAAERGERSAIYTFDERVATLTERCESVNIPVSEHGRARHALDCRRRSTEVLARTSSPTWCDATSRRNGPRSS